MGGVGVILLADERFTVGCRCVAPRFDPVSDAKQREGLNETETRSTSSCRVRVSSGGTVAG